MPVINEAIPENLKPYQFHGISFDYKKGEKQANAECPFCSKNKFSVNIETSKFQCFACGERGNSTMFLRKLYERSLEETSDYSELIQSRKILHAESFMRWGVCKSVFTGDWLVPAYNSEGNVCQLYLYKKIGDKMILSPTAGLGQHLFRPIDFNSKPKKMILCEGIWDAIALDETLRMAKISEEGKISQTSNPSRSMAASISIVATPGCNVFRDDWQPMFGDKEVTILFDSDHPKFNEKLKKESPPAGFNGLKRVVGILRTAKKPPSEIKYLHWGKDGYDPELPSGFDTRDFLSRGKDGKSRVKLVSDLFGKIKETPGDWMGTKKASAKSKASLMFCESCDRYDSMILAWKKALKWIPGLDSALTVMLSSIISTKSAGDPLWVKIIGPASCGKSTLCEALSINKEYVIAKSTIRGFHSGFSNGVDESGEREDNSLIVQAHNKTLVVKDGDTLLQSPNLSQILAEARDVYDKTSRTHYRHGISRDYEDINLTWILCGTASLRAIDSSELGERFLDCVIMERIDDDLEDEILWRAANKSDKNLNIESTGEIETKYSPELAKAMQLTGGYVSYLRENASELFSMVDMSEKALKYCTRLGKFVAFMRARPSRYQDENAERELAARLVSQHVRLAKCITVVKNKHEPDDEVLKLTRKVSLDTSRGVTLDIARELFNNADKGCEVKYLAMRTNIEDTNVRKLLKFLQKIECVESFQSQITKGVKGAVRWRLKPKLHTLFKEVMYNA